MGLPKLWLSVHRSTATIIICFWALLAACQRPLTNSNSGLSPEAGSGLWTDAQQFTIGEIPVWIEILPDGPRQLAGPAEAALTVFEPWPLALRPAGFVQLTDQLTVTVNRYGFISLKSLPGRKAAIKAFSGGQDFSAYSVAVVFKYQDQATAVLYRDYFFEQTVWPAPAARLLSLDSKQALVVQTKIPFLDIFQAANNWDIVALALDDQGLWHFQARQAESGEIAYAYGNENLGVVQADGPSDFRRAQTPRPRHLAPLPLGLALEAAAEDLDENEALVVLCLGPEPLVLPYLVQSVLEPNLEAEPTLAAAFYDEHKALLLFPDGQYCRANSNSLIVYKGCFPELPTGFYYSTVAITDSLIIAAWEEQKDLAVGSSGLLLWQPAWITDDHSTSLSL